MDVIFNFSSTALSLSFPRHPLRSPTSKPKSSLAKSPYPARKNRASRSNMRSQLLYLLAVPFLFFGAAVPLLDKPPLQDLFKDFPRLLAENLHPTSSRVEAFKPGVCMRIRELCFLLMRNWIASGSHKRARRWLSEAGSMRRISRPRAFIT